MGERRPRICNTILRPDIRPVHGAVEFDWWKMKYFSLKVKNSGKQVARYVRVNYKINTIC